MIDILPTRERMTKGDLTLNNGKIIGSGGQFMVDKLLERGVISHEQHRHCVTYRYCYEAFIHHLGVRAFDYGVIKSGGSVEQWQVDRISAKDRFVRLQHALEKDILAALSWVVLHDNPYTSLDKVLKCSRSSVRTRLGYAIDKMGKLI